MHIKSLFSRFQTVLTIEDLRTAINEIAQSHQRTKIALLLPKGEHEINRQTWLGSVSKTMTEWVESDVVRRELEGEHALIPLVYTATDSDLQTGLVVSTNTPSYASVWLAVECIDRAIDEQEVLEYIVLSRYIADAFHRITTNDKSLLTQRERQCMSWIAQGKTSWEVAQILGLTERTINFHIQNCIDKTNSVNRIQATAKCITHALINVSH